MLPYKPELRTAGCLHMVYSPSLGTFGHSFLILYYRKKEIYLCSLEHFEKLLTYSTCLYNDAHILHCSKKKPKP